MTETEMLELLRKRYTEKTGNGDAWAFIPQVRNAAGHNASRTADAIAMALWPSRGLVLHGFEIKVSRSDWIRELRNPAKAEAFHDLVDYWWIVAADAKVVAAGELPEGWGLLVAQGNRLTCSVEAKVIRMGPTELGRAKPLPPGFGRSYLAALLRAGCRVSAATPAEITAAAETARSEERARSDREIERLREEIKGWQETSDAFAKETGLSIGSWLGGNADRAREIGAAIRDVISGHNSIENRRKTLRRLADQARTIAETVDRELDELGEAEAA